VEAGVLLTAEAEKLFQSGENGRYPVHTLPERKKHRLMTQPVKARARNFLPPVRISGAAK
jgi:hypothetical protein